MNTHRFTFGLDRFSGLYLWALFITVFSIWEPHIFPTMATVHAVASEQSIVGILALAALVPMIGGNYDLSIGAMANFSTIMVAWLQTNNHWGMWPSIYTVLAVSALVGVANGFVVVRLHVNSFIVTLGMATIMLAFQTMIAGVTQPLTPVTNLWLKLTQYSIGGFQIVFLYLLVIAALLYWILEKTPPGRYLHAVGGNSEAARLSGVNVDKWVWLSFVASATISGLAGVFFASLLGSSMTYGPGLLLPAFAAAFLGSTQLKPGRFNVWGTMLAVYVLATGVEGLALLTGVQWLSGMFNGVALIVAVAFATWRQRVSQNRRRVFRYSEVRSSTNNDSEGMVSKEEEIQRM